MDEKSKVELDKILQLDADSLTQGQKAFLNARRTYLNKEQRRIFSSVLVNEKEAEDRGEKEVKAEQPLPVTPVYPKTGPKLESTEQKKA